MAHAIYRLLIPICKNSLIESLKLSIIWHCFTITDLFILINRLIPSSEHERMRVGNEKWKSHFMQLLTNIQGIFWNFESPKDEKVSFRFPSKAWKTSCFVKWAILHFEVHSNVLPWTIDQAALKNQFHNQVGVQIRCGMGKSVEGARALSIQRHGWQFYPDEPLIFRWPKSHLFLIEVSFSVEILQFWGEMVAQGISGSKLVLHVPCRSPALGVSGIMAFSRSS